MPKRKTHEEFIEEVYSLVGEEYTVLSEYLGSYTKILFRHNSNHCNNQEFYMKPCKFLEGQRCNVLNSTKKKNIEDIKNEIYQINPNIKILGEYKNVDTPIKCKCLIHNYIWNPTISNLRKYKRCPICNNWVRLTNEEFISNLKKISPNIKILTEFINQKIKVECECLIDGYRWKTTPDSLLRGSNCKKCSYSKGEKEINKILKKYNQNFDVQYKFDDCKNKRCLPFDFIVFDNIENKIKCLVEYDGELHYQTHRFIKDNNIAQEKLKSCQKHDEIKNQYCKDNNIKLLRIPYWEFNNIENILKEVLK